MRMNDPSFIGSQPVAFFAAAAALTGHSGASIASSAAMPFQVKHLH